MNYIEKHPFSMILLGIFGISLSSIFVRYSPAPSAVTAAWRLVCTVILMTPAVLGSKEIRKELGSISFSAAALSIASGVFLALHFVT